MRPTPIQKQWLREQEEIMLAKYRAVMRYNMGEPQQMFIRNWHLGASVPPPDSLWKQIVITYEDGTVETFNSDLTGRVDPPCP